MNKIIQHTKETALVILSGVCFVGVCVFAACGTGCAGNYNPDGTLTEETKTQIQQGAEIASGVANSVAPGSGVAVNALAAIVGGVMTLVGKGFYDSTRKKS